VDLVWCRTVEFAEPIVWSTLSAAVSTGADVITVHDLLCAYVGAVVIPLRSDLVGAELRWRIWHGFAHSRVSLLTSGPYHCTSRICPPRKDI
jgi:hypothetical protein